MAAVDDPVAPIQAEPDEAVERFDPAIMDEQLIESEHLARYRWAAKLAARRRILDAGCGTGYGLAILIEAGALEGVGVDVSAEAIEAAALRVPGNVTLELGDLNEIAQPDESFDLIVCFEVLEHLETPDRALDEFHRLLKPEGVLLVSSPNRHVYTKGNPHHVHEYVPDELEAALGQRFAHVILRRQHAWIVSGIFDDAGFESGGDAVLDGVEVRKLTRNMPGREIYTLAMASQSPLPQDHRVVEMNTAVELRQWDALWQEQREFIERQKELMDGQAIELRQQATELAHLRAQLLEAERELAPAAQLREELAEVQGILALLAGVGEARDQWEARYKSVVDSRTWRLTEPLRSLVRSLR